ncbi:ribosomal protein L32 [Hymenobacter sp. 15J16-1T3B]|uniref:ribosomal protein L32 n=1 Tax=Hymenobacter sp. 15J16-1T3B TaxID=2886941 RepID=UPI001D0FFEF0|nr:ribosomal protein L32 [Hymenobacter sp. 15J16-1T3B]MCC3159494.1 ribosomal protein L32 [Hymenobacter sp. 15J16-1T3B]
MPTPSSADVHYAAIGATAQQLAHLATGPAPDYHLMRNLIGRLTAEHLHLVRLRLSAPPPANPRPWHEVLGLTPNATRQQVQEAYGCLGLRGPVPLPVLNQAYDAALAATEPAEDSHEPDAAPAGTYGWDDDGDDGDDFNPDACPVCGEDIAGHAICMGCGYIAGLDGDDD